MAEQPQGLLVGPVQILQAQHQTVAARGSDQSSRDCVAPPECQRGRRLGRGRQDLGWIYQVRGDVGRAQLGDKVRPRPQGRRVIVRGGSSDRRRDATFPGSGQRLGQHRRLSDTGLSGHQDGGTAAREGCREQPLDLGQLAVPADQHGVHVSSVPRLALSLGEC
jgi:hypothetical protein